MNGFSASPGSSRESFAYIHHHSSDQPRASPSYSEQDGLLRARRNKTWELEPESSSSLRQTVPYENFESIDWIHERAKSRKRTQRLAGQTGIRAKLAVASDTVKPWVVILLTGLGTGLTASYLDITALWLSDLRTGVCVENFWLDQRGCCSGLDVSETCYSYATWTQALNLRNMFVSSTLQYLIYLVLAIAFSATSAFLVLSYAPFAFHSGIPEVKTVLGGFRIEGFLSGRTFLIKSLGLALSVASGLSLGKEGPMVHIASCIGNFFADQFQMFRGNEARRREILSASAAAGLSVAFGAPVSGVLFSLEEASSYFEMHVLWQAFVCAIVAAITLQYMDVFGTGKLVLFEVTASQKWRDFEVVPFLFLGICGGLAGHFFTRLNVELQRLRQSTPIITNYPITEVAVIAFVTALCSYLIPFMRIQTSSLVTSLFEECSTYDPHGLCNSDKTFSTIVFLLITCAAKFLFTAVTFGTQVPAGVFLPTMAAGAAFGRAVGTLVSSVQQAYPTAAIFASCTPDEQCINLAAYAVVGAASFLSGVTRMTLSLVCIFFELTGAIDLVLQLMIAVMASKFTADYEARDGIYESWIHLRNFPFLNPKVDYRNEDATAADVMTGVEDLVCLPRSEWTLAQLGNLLEEESFRGFPIVNNQHDKVLLGYITRGQLRAAISHAQHQPETDFDSTLCDLVREDADAENGRISLAPFVEATPITLASTSPLEMVVQMFQRMGLRYVLLTKYGRLAGILTKHDIHYLISSEGESSSRADLQKARDQASAKTFEIQQGVH